MVWCVIVAACLSLAACTLWQAAVTDEGNVAHDPASIIPCEHHTAAVTAWSSTERATVGEPVSVTVRIENTGCVMLGLPQYRLNARARDGEPIVDPNTTQPVVHSLGVDSGASDEAVFAVIATRPGVVEVSPSVSFEVHLGYPGPAYWGMAAGDAVRVVVTD